MIRTALIILFVAELFSIISASLAENTKKPWATTTLDRRN